MKRTLFISMLLCLFALVAKAQTQDVGIQGYYKYTGSPMGTVGSELKLGSDDPREYTEIGLRANSTVEIYITEPQTGSCTFRVEGSYCERIQSSDRMCVIRTRSASIPTGYSTLHIWCGDKYLEVRIYVTN